MATAPGDSSCGRAMQKLRTLAKKSGSLLVVGDTLVGVASTHRSILPLRSKCQIADSTAEECIKSIASGRSREPFTCPCCTRMPDDSRLILAWSDTTKVVVQIKALREIERRACSWNTLCKVLVEERVVQAALFVPCKRSDRHNHQKKRGRPSQGRCLHEPRSVPGHSPGLHLGFIFGRRFKTKTRAVDIPFFVASPKQARGVAREASTIPVVPVDRNQGGSAG